MLEKVHIIVTLIVALIITIVCIVFNVDFFSLCVTLIFVIIVFYFLGLYLRSVLLKIFNDEEVLEEDDDDSKDDENTDDADANIDYPSNNDDDY